VGCTGATHHPGAGDRSPEGERRLPGLLTRLGALVAAVVAVGLLQLLLVGVGMLAAVLLLLAVELLANASRR
jgi:hypothetical protein